MVSVRTLRPPAIACERYERTPVDFWELTKLLFRRWYFSVPMLLLSVAATLFAGASVKPDYDAKLHLQLIPPLSATDAPGVKTQPRNPWVELGIESIGNAAIIAVGDKAVLDNLVKDGYTDNIVVTMDNRTPVITVEAIGSSPKQATESAHAMAKIVDQNVLSLQKAYGAPQGQLITTRSLDTGDNVEKVTSKVKRALAVIGGVGLLLTSAVTIGLDALLRGRARRRALAADVERSSDKATTSGSAPASAETVTRRIKTTSASGRAGSAATVYRSAGSQEGEQSAPESTEATQPVPGPRRANGNESAAERLVAPAESDAEERPRHRSANEEAAAERALADDDATIVLPLPHKDWAAQGGGGKRR